MQRKTYTFHPRTACKKGFALILTLSVLAVISALSAVLISYLDTARKESGYSKAMIQGDLYYADIKKLFKGFKDKKALYSMLYLAPFPIVSPDGRFSVIVACRPLANAVNVNWLGFASENNATLYYDTAQKVFDTVVQNYELEDPSKLEEMIIEEIAPGKKVVLKEQSRLAQKNGIISHEQFNDILDRYQRASDDSKVGQIPWDKFFTFTAVSKDLSENLIDGDYLSAELIATLFDIDIESVKDEWVAGALELKTFVNNMGATYDPKLFAKEFLAQSQCEIAYDYEGQRFSFRFEDIEGEVKHFEFLGKQ